MQSKRSFFISDNVYQSLDTAALYCNRSKSDIVNLALVFLFVDHPTLESIRSLVSCHGRVDFDENFFKDGSGYSEVF